MKHYYPFTIPSGLLQWDRLPILADHIQESEWNHADDCAELLRSDIRLNVEGGEPTERHKKLLAKFPIPKLHFKDGIRFGHPCAEWYTRVAGNSYRLWHNIQYLKTFPLSTLTFMSLDEYTLKVINAFPVQCILIDAVTHDLVLREIVSRLEFLDYCAQFELHTRNEYTAHLCRNILLANLKVNKGCMIRVFVNSQKYYEGEKK